MEADQCLPKASVTGGAKHNLELEGAICQLQAELAERKHVEEELCRRVSALELRLTESSGRLTAVKEELRQEKQGRTEDQKETDLLAENLVRQKKCGQCHESRT